MSRGINSAPTANNVYKTHLMFEIDQKVAFFEGQMKALRIAYLKVFGLLCGYKIGFFGT